MNNGMPAPSSVHSHIWQAWSQPGLCASCSTAAEVAKPEFTLCSWSCTGRVPGRAEEPGCFPPLPPPPSPPASSAPTLDVVSHTTKQTEPCKYARHIRLIELKDVLAFAQMRTQTEKGSAAAYRRQHQSPNRAAAAASAKGFNNGRRFDHCSLKQVEPFINNNAGSPAPKITALLHQLPCRDGVSGCEEEQGAFAAGRRLHRRRSMTVCMSNGSRSERHGHQQRQQRSQEGCSRERGGKLPKSCSALLQQHLLTRSLPSQSQAAASARKFAGAQPWPLDRCRTRTRAALTCRWSPRPSGRG